MSTLGDETNVGREIERALGKRKSKQTPMLGQFHGKAHFNVLTSGIPQLELQRAPKKSRGRASPFPSGVLSAAPNAAALPSNILSDPGIPVTQQLPAYQVP